MRIVILRMAVCWAAWAAAGVAEAGDPIADFTFPWSDRIAPRTVVNAESDNERLQFTFTVTDSHVICSDDWNGESTLDLEDRVEVFIAKDAQLADYWCIEVDPLGRVHDYHAQHYRRFDSDWDCPGLETTSRRTAEGYTVTISIPLQSLSELLDRPVRQGSEIRIGLFRAEFYGTGPSARGEAPDNWISWVRPESNAPDFHIPSALRTWTVP